MRAQSEYFWGTVRDGKSYFAEKVVYGGMETTRGEMISDLQRKARFLTSDKVRQQNLVSRFLQGFER
jgi:adenosyl cobinamide kinase/adenosyl cobinamide phosphate guanylyltransferase